jgi:hypothetical protein
MANRATAANTTRITVRFDAARAESGSAAWTTVRKSAGHLVDAPPGNNLVRCRIRRFVTTIRSLTGVYNARGTIMGELAYVAGKVSGRGHCGLCDITHGLRLHERAEWREQRRRLRVQFETVHLDERSPEVARACPAAPCVLAHTDDGVIPLLGPAEINGFAGSGEALISAIDRVAAARGLTFASPAA